MVVLQTENNGRLCIGVGWGVEGTPLMECRGPREHAGECVQVAAEYVGLRLQLGKYRGAGDRLSVVMGEWAVLGEMKDGRARRNQPACVLASYIIIYSRVFLPEEKDHK